MLNGFASIPLAFVFTLNKDPDKWYFLISPFFKPFNAVDIYRSLFLEPPKVQLVIFFTGNFGELYQGGI